MSASADRITGRMAQCSCGNERKSSPLLEQYDYRGPGSYHALNHCGNCGFEVGLHNARPDLTCGKFKSAGAADHDAFYCGHFEAAADL